MRPALARAPRAAAPLPDPSSRTPPQPKRRPRRPGSEDLTNALTVPAARPGGRVRDAGYSSSSPCSRRRTESNSISGRPATARSMVSRTSRTWSGLGGDHRDPDLGASGAGRARRPRRRTPRTCADTPRAAARSDAWPSANGSHRAGACRRPRFRYTRPKILTSSSAAGPQIGVGLDRQRRRVLPPSGRGAPRVPGAGAAATAR